MPVDVQGYLVEKLSGQPLPEFLRQEIFEPLGMHDTAFYVPAAKMDRLATVYRLIRRAGDSRQHHTIRSTDGSRSGVRRRRALFDRAGLLTVRADALPTAAC